MTEHADFGRDNYRKVRERVHRPPSSLAAIATVALVATTVTTGLWLTTSPQLAIRVLGQVVVALAAFQAFAVLHDCGHGSFSKSAVANIAVGHVMGVLCVMPFYSWKFIHQQHHVWAGSAENDPAAAIVHRWRQGERISSLTRVLWRSWLPFVALQQQIVLTLYPLRMLREGTLNRNKAAKSAASLAFVVCALATAHFALPEVINIQLWPAAVAYLSITELINLPHHLDRLTLERRLPVWEQWRIARSCQYPPLVSYLVALNFNLHVEHHMFPDVPWYRLQEVRSHVRPLLDERYEESVGARWVFRNRSRSLEAVVKSPSI
ncbi:MAG: fatty acid desaturase [Myxococcota bacterium]